MIETTDVSAKSILFAWELGANLGHLKPMAALARALAQRGARITFAVRDLSNVRHALKQGEFAVLQAPQWPEHRHGGYRPDLASYADVLTEVGFGDQHKVAAVADAWVGMLDLIKPDLVVADHAPALQVAMFGRAEPLVCLGTPFTLPPLSLDRLPPIRADQAPALPEARLHQSVKAVLAARRVQPPARFVDTFCSEERLIFGLPELDPYRAYRAEPLLSPLETLPSFVEAPVKPHVFLYAGDELPHLETLVQCLVQMDVEVTAYLRGDVGPLPHFLKHRGHDVFDTPPPLDQILPRVSHVLSQGGAFSCHAAIAAGRPHLIMPLHNETELNFALSASMGLARRLDPAKDEKLVRRKLNDFLVDTQLIRYARHWALTVRNRGQRDGLAAAIEAVERCLARDQIRNSRLRSAAAAAHPS